METTNIPGVHRRGPVELPGVDMADDMPSGDEGPTSVEFEPDELAEPADDELVEHPENNANLQPVAVEDAGAENVEAADIIENDPPPAVENPPAVQLHRSSRSTKGQARKQQYQPTMQGKWYSYHAQAHLLLDGDEDSK